MGKKNTNEMQSIGRLQIFPSKLAFSHFFLNIIIFALDMKQNK